MDFVKANWKQGVTLAASVVVAGLLLTHKIEPRTAVGIGSLLALLGIHLEPIDYAGGK
jgi:hypothetical protein